MVMSVSIEFVIILVLLELIARPNFLLLSAKVCIMYVGSSTYFTYLTKKIST